MRKPGMPYAYSAGIIALVTAASMIVQTHLDPANLTMLYLLGVVIIALQWGRGPAVLGATLGVAAFDFFFVPPRFTFAVEDTQYLLTFAGLLVVGVVISSLAGRAREQAQAARQREASTAALYALSGDLVAASSVEGIAQAVARHVAATFSREVAVLVPREGRLQAVYQAPDFFPAGEAHQVKSLTRMVLYRVHAGADRRPCSLRCGRRTRVCSPVSHEGT